MFYSDVLDLGYEAVGRCDPSLEVVLDGPAAAPDADPSTPGAAIYLDDDRPVGVLTWNAFGHLDEARRWIRAGEPVGAEGLRGRLDLDG